MGRRRPAWNSAASGVAGLGGTAGALYTAAGIGALFGPPLAGYVVDATGSYRPAIVRAMVLAVAALAVILTLKPRRPSG